MTTFPQITDDERIRRLQHPGRPVRIVLDTDTFNEIDDQFAVIYAMKSSTSVSVEALYAAPFYNELSESPWDGMEKSYQEILKIRQLAQREDIPVHRGSGSYLPGADVPVDSDAARDLVHRALASSPDDPLYVVAIGAITNVASAILLEPEIINRIVVVWLGGHSLHWPDTREFNLAQDLHGSRLLLGCGVPLVLVPCMGTASHLLTTLSELETHIKHKGEVGQYLYDTYRNCSPDHYAYSRVIWDISVIAWLAVPEACPSILVPSPRISEDFRWVNDPTRHQIRYIYHVNRDAVFRDLFNKIAEAK
ncbi:MULTISPECIES: nucleoside hydrolase [Paenibacillus]|uniref:nucleoside hydrolase n=1 Tax=Paenibacillus TaxID=44249 RepID=UPI000CF857C0|nr:MULTISPECIES: nucleoside hydrolase [Paenibacillus]MBJ9987487.1 nucleoside hydrolase [Paenibacillus sp. S28]PQP88981.1 nucleoside hydrolase [Paenibacillus sp. AR247]